MPFSPSRHRFLVFALALSPLCAVHGAAAGELEKIRAAGMIQVAHRDASVPFSYLDEDQQPIGYAMDLCKKFVEAVRVHLHLSALPIGYLPVTSATRIAAISGGRASLECGSTTNTAERRQQVDYTIPHFISSSRLVVRRDEGLDRIEDLAGRRAVSTQGTTNIKTLVRINQEKALGIRVMEAKDHAEGFAMVVDGRADAFAMDDVLLFGLRANAADPARYAVVGKPMTIEPYAVMLPKGDAAFKKVIDDEMRRIIQSGEIYAIYAKWFQRPIPPKGVNLGLPMPYLLRELFKFPSDKVGDLGL